MAGHMRTPHAHYALQMRPQHFLLPRLRRHERAARADRGLRPLARARVLPAWRRRSSTLFQLMQKEHYTVLLLRTACFFVDCILLIAFIAFKRLSPNTHAMPKQGACLWARLLSRYCRDRAWAAESSRLLTVSLQSAWRRCGPLSSPA